MLGHEKLDVYRLSVQFVALAFSVGEQLPKGYGPIAEQLRRAATSIVANIAEGCGRTGKQDYARHMAIARGSAGECAALLDVVLVTVKEPPVQAQVGKGLLVRIVAMLTRLCRHVPAGRRGEETG